MINNDEPECAPFHAKMVHIEGTAGQDAYARRKFNNTEVKGERLLDLARSKKCPSCNKKMKVIAHAAHVVTEDRRRLLVHTCAKCNNFHNDQDVRSFKLPLGTRYYDLNFKKVRTQV